MQLLAAPLRKAARAFACFLRPLRESIIASMLVLRVSNVALWVRMLSQWGATCVSEADCKEQFNRIRPNLTVKELQEASQYLYQKGQWGADTIMWSIHRDCKELGRAGRAASSAFWHFSHEELTQLVQFSLTEYYQVWCAGAMWKRSDAIPMGGSFSAQCADLHRSWALKQGVEIMRRFGTLIEQEPFPVWEAPAGNTVSLSQFCDNVNVAAKGPSASNEMSRVCDAVSQCWNLPVRCGCLSRGDVCNGSCMKDSLRTLGVTIHVGSSVMCLSTPSALKDTWKLKWGPSLHSPWAVNTGHLSNIFIGPPVNSLPVNFSWACLLLSISSWMQLACLCDHTTATVLRAMKRAIHRVCSTGPWCLDATISWAVLQARHLPTTPRCSAGRLQTWFKWEAFWYNGMYVSWHALHSGECSATCAPWNADFDILAYKQVDRGVEVM